MCGHTCVVVLTLLILWRCHFRDSQAPIAHVGVGRALTGAGWGVFALNNIACNSFICLYTVIYIYIYLYLQCLRRFFGSLTNSISEQPFVTQF